MARRVTLPQSKLKARRRMIRLRLTIALSVLVLLIIGCFVCVLWVPYLRIHTADVRGNETVSSESINARVQEAIDGTYFNIFPKDNMFLYPKNIANTLIASYPMIKTADVRIENPETLKVTIVERHAAARWCQGTPKEPGDCYLMDEAGLVYMPAPDNNILTPYYGSIATGTMPVQYLKPGDLGPLAALVAAFAAKMKDTSVESVAVNADRDVTLYFLSGFSVRFAMKDVTGNVFEIFNLALSAEPFLSRPLSDFEYLDLRFGDKLYYHLKNK